MRRLETPQSICRFGIAQADITPPVGIYHRMWGAARHDQATGVHRPLRATAVALFPADVSDPRPSDGQVILALDHCLLWGDEMRQLLDHLEAETGVPRESLLVAFSHTHAAGLMGAERAELPGGHLIAGYLESLAASSAKIVQQALAQSKPATITYGRGGCSLATNRDYWDADSNQHVCGFNPDGPADDTVLVGRVSDLQDKTLATLVNYACHPTTLAWDNTLISPDFPGAMREVVEQASGAPCVFLQGASGDIGPRDGFVGDVAVADRNGRQLGFAVLEALESLPPAGTWHQYQGPVVSGATIGAWAHLPVDEASQARHRRWQIHHETVPLKYRDDLPDADETRAALAHWQQVETDARAAGNEQQASDARAMVERQTRRLKRVSALPAGAHLPMPVSIWRIGDAVWVALDGEHYNLLQRTLRERFAGRPVWILTLVNGSRSWYLPSADAYGKGLYQEAASVLDRGCLETLMEAIANSIDKLDQQAAGSAG